jgi:adenosylcobinamide-phosphate synthase
MPAAPEPGPLGSTAAANTAGLLLGFALDRLVRDPRRGHPVAVFGRAAAALEARVYADSRSAGVLYTGMCVTGAVALGLVAERLVKGRTPLARTAVTAAATWAVLGGSSLAREGTFMARALEDAEKPAPADCAEADGLMAARARLSHLCARDPRGLDAKALARATVESIAENTSDAAVAPLLWGAVAGVPGLLAYRAINTLDAMVGYRSARYENFGWASARLDDLANWVPARATGLLTVACAPFARTSSPAEPSGRRGPDSGAMLTAITRSYAALRRDGGAHPSPNAGRCEAAFAGALGVRLGGVNVYGGKVERRPELGDGSPPEVGDIRRAVRLSRAVTVAAAALSAVISWGDLGSRAARRSAVDAGARRLPLG